MYSLFRTKHIYIIYTAYLCNNIMTPLPPLVRSIQGGFRRYAKGRYAVRRNSVISYADINFYFKKVQFTLKNTTHVTYKVK